MTEIDQIIDACIAEIQRTTDRLDARNNTYPIIGIKDCIAWDGGDIESIVGGVNSLVACRVIYAGSKTGELLNIGGSTSEEKQVYRILLVVSSLRAKSQSARSAYEYIEAIKTCFARFKLPVKGFLRYTEDNLLLVRSGRYAYGFDLERNYTRS